MSFIVQSLAAAANRFPDCLIANCRCKQNAWTVGCWCMCHFFAMNEVLGKEKWSLRDFAASVREGKPILKT